MQSQVNIWKSINVTYYINRINKTHIFLIDAEKAFDNILYPFYDKKPYEQN